MHCCARRTKSLQPRFICQVTCLAIEALSAQTFASQANALAATIRAAAACPGLQGSNNSPLSSTAQLDAGRSSEVTAVDEACAHGTNQMRLRQPAVPAPAVQRTRDQESHPALLHKQGRLKCWSILWLLLAARLSNRAFKSFCGITFVLYLCCCKQPELHCWRGTHLNARQPAWLLTCLQLPTHSLLLAVNVQSFGQLYW